MLIQVLAKGQSNITPTDNQPYDYANVLGWANAPGNPYNLCGGYYLLEGIPYTMNPLTPLSQHNNYNIAADRITYSLHGTSVFRGNVRVSQSGRELNTGLAYLYRNPQTGKVDRITMYQGVRLYSPQMMIYGRYGSMDLKNNAIHLHNTAYRNVGKSGLNSFSLFNFLTGKTETRSFGMHYWGHANETNQTEPKVYIFKHATYTTCAPSSHCAWQLHATTVEINKKTQKGTAWNAVLWVKQIPIFWFPYLSYPLNHQRKTGFLTPTYGHSQTAGTEIGLPFYWNMAPNYDMLIHTTYMSNRGFEFVPRFRYLTERSRGADKITFLPNDKEFKHFKKTAPSEYNTNAYNQAGLNQLTKDSDNRFGINIGHDTVFNKNLEAAAEYNYVNDDYVIQDLHSGVGDASSILNINNSNTNLLQRGYVNYQGMTWNFLGMLQNYQTLHPVNQAEQGNQYARLPEISAGAGYPDIYKSLDFSFGSDDVQFYEEKTPGSTTKPVIGNRFSLRPEFDYPIVRSYGYFNTRLQEQVTSYHLSQEGNLSADPGVEVPLFDIHSGLYFTRDFSFFRNSYVETLEPELFYLYVPYRNQDGLPLFDTGGQPFTYNTMMLDNPFTGIDRIQNANQMAYAVTTRFINENTGDQQGSASIGQTLYFVDRKVQLCTKGNCGPLSTLDKRALSPVTGQGTYDFNDGWNTNVGATWNPYAQALSNGNLGLTYRNSEHVLNFNYGYTKDGGEISGEPAGTDIATSQSMTVSGQWMIKQHWDVLGEYAYNWATSGVGTNEESTSGRATSYLGGLEYTSCCWAVRFVASRVFQGIYENEPFYNDAYFVQFDLKGLGSVGNQDASGVLSADIPGFNNTFDPEIADTGNEVFEKATGIQPAQPPTS